MQKAIDIINKINNVDGFNPMELAVNYSNVVTGEVKVSLPVRAQVAHFRLLYPLGQLVTEVGKYDEKFAEATAYVYTSGGEDKILLAKATSVKRPTDMITAYGHVGWAETDALGRALTIAGFGLCAEYSGDVYEGVIEKPITDHTTAPKETEVPKSVVEKKAEKAAAATKTPAAEKVVETPAVTEPEKVVEAPVAAEPAKAAVKEMTFEEACEVECDYGPYTGLSLFIISQRSKIALPSLVKHTTDQKIKRAGQLILDKLNNAG